MIMTSMETAAEMCTFAEKTKLGPNSILKLFEALMPTSPHVHYTRQMISGDYTKDHVSIDNCARMGHSAKLEEFTGRYRSITRFNTGRKSDGGR
jgi:hypothetical protein